MEYIETFNLDPQLAYTPAINKAMLDKVELENYHYYTQGGIKDAEARTMARNERVSAERTINDLMKRH